MALLHFHDDASHIKAAMTNGCITESEDPHLPLSLLSLENREKYINLRPRQSQLLDSENFEIQHAVPSDDDRNDDCSFQHGRGQVRDEAIESRQLRDDLMLSMRGSRNSNPFHPSGFVTPVPFRQSLSRHEHGLMKSNEDGCTVFPVPQTPKLVKKSLARMPPPCRPGDYENDQMDWENRPPCRVLLPDF